MTAEFGERDAARIRVGQTATVSVPGVGGTFTARVRSVATLPSSSGTRVTYEVTLLLERTVPGLRPGMTAEVRLVLEASR